MLSVEIPSGYAFEQFDGLRMIRSGIVPELKEVDTTQHGQTGALALRWSESSNLIFLMSIFQKSVL